MDESIRNVVEVHLHQGEKLQWAEKVDVELREEWVKNSVNEGRIWSLPFFLIGMIIIWAVVSTDRRPDAEVWIVVLSSIPPLIFGCLVLFSSVLGFKSFFGNSHFQKKRPFKFYALTNRRLLYFDSNNNLIIERDAINATKAHLFKKWQFPKKWKTLCLTLSPVGGGIWKISEIYFLHNFEKSKHQIQTVLDTKEETP